MPGRESKAGTPEDRKTSRENMYTVPDEALRFAVDTGVDALAVSIGTAHGVYTAEPDLDIERLKLIRDRVDVPLVLHGGSGTPEDQVRESIQAGIAKVNVATFLLNEKRQMIQDSGSNHFFHENDSL